MTLWEVAIAEYLKPLGYASALSAGGTRGTPRPCADPEGFDEWYGVHDSSDESQRSTFNDTPYIWEGPRGRPRAR